MTSFTVLKRIPDSTRPVAVAIITLVMGRDCPDAHLHYIGIFKSVNCYIFKHCIDWSALNSIILLNSAAFLIILNN